jgi:hypothetical protein
MATTLYFRTTADSGMHRGTNSAKLDGSASPWRQRGLTTGRGTSTSPVTLSGETVNGPTNGVEVGSTPDEFISDPLAASVTISSTITLNLWANESSMNANASINAIIERLDSTGAVVSTIARTARTAELGTSSAAANFTVAPTSTAMNKGDRFRVRVYADDAASSMVGGYSVAFQLDRSSAGVDGDSYLTFTETVTFQDQSSTPGGSTLYLTDTAGPAVGAQVEKEMWTGRGDGVNSIGVNTAAGWTAPIQWTDSGGGTVVEWYSRPLAAFTLAGLVRVNIRAQTSSASASSGLRAEIAVCNGDGSGAAVWAAACFTALDLSNPTGYITHAAETPHSWVLAGVDTAVSAGQRIRLRAYIDDVSNFAMTNGFTATLYYDGTSGGASGDSYIILPQAVSEYSAYQPRHAAADSGLALV